ncbi:hypothetical protein NPIL_658781 [Nephila pilipes]|uniref:Uncharacterized protein n=1 Tax=Nephila pilipes TaxID=299642 RepID=A0A8X6NR15_NEPPI|nr:hypothetical protein NPIL_658781 [Nephila pilipes]
MICWEALIASQRNISCSRRKPVKLITVTVTQTEILSQNGKIEYNIRGVSGKTLQRQLRYTSDVKSCTSEVKLRSNFSFPVSLEVLGQLVMKCTALPPSPHAPVLLSAIPNL